MGAAGQGLDLLCSGCWGVVPGVPGEGLLTFGASSTRENSGDGHKEGSGVVTWNSVRAEEAHPCRR